MKEIVTYTLSLLLVVVVVVKVFPRGWRKIYIPHERLLRGLPSPSHHCDPATVQPRVQADRCHLPTDKTQPQRYMLLTVRRGGVGAGHQFSVLRGFPKRDPKEARGPLLKPCFVPTTNCLVNKRRKVTNSCSLKSVFCFNRKL